MNKTLSFFITLVILAVNINVHGWVVDYPYDVIIVTAGKPDGVEVPSMQMILRAKQAADLHENIQSRYYIVCGREGSGKSPENEGMLTNLLPAGDPKWENWMDEWYSWHANPKFCRYVNDRIPGGVMLHIMLKSWGIDVPFLIIVDDPADVGAVCLEKGFTKIGVIGNGTGPEGRSMESLSIKGLSFTAIADYSNPDSVYQWIVDRAWVKPFNAREQSIPLGGVEAVIAQSYIPGGSCGNSADSGISSDGTEKWHKWNSCHHRELPCYHSALFTMSVEEGRVARAVNNFKQRNSKLLALTGNAWCEMTAGERLTIEAVAHGVPAEKIFVDRHSSGSGGNVEQAYYAMVQRACTTAMYTSNNGSSLGSWAITGSQSGTLTSTYGTEAKDGESPAGMIGPSVDGEMYSISQLAFGKPITPYQTIKARGGWINAGETMHFDYHNGSEYAHLTGLDLNARIFLENAVTGESFEITTIQKLEKAFDAAYIYSVIDLEFDTPDTIPQGVYNLVFLNADGHAGYHRAALGVGAADQINVDSLYRVMYHTDFTVPYTVHTKLINCNKNLQISFLPSVYPNPIAGKTYVSFYVQNISPGNKIAFSVYNVSGRFLWGKKISVMSDRISAIWDGKDNKGRSLGSGAYFLMVQYNGIKKVRQ
ncbi:MAG: T9SS type A sorting domain-containing protein, partial [bacterium]